MSRSLQSALSDTDVCDGCFSQEKSKVQPPLYFLFSTSNTRMKLTQPGAFQEKKTHSTSAESRNSAEGHGIWQFLDEWIKSRPVGWISVSVNIEAVESDDVLRVSGWSARSWCFSVSLYEHRSLLSSASPFHLRKLLYHIHTETQSSTSQHVKINVWFNLKKL